MHRANQQDTLHLIGEERPALTGAPSRRSTWATPPRHPRLVAGQVHIWRGRLDVAPAELAAYRRSLDADELARASRFVRDEDRNRWIAARGFLRTVLGAYVGVAPAAVRFRYGRYGKPELRGAGRTPGFNLAHSGEWALCAVAPARWVGVDIERVRPDLSIEEMAGVLTPAERQELRSMDGAERAHRFFEMWTRKEALAKALGAGVSLPFDRLDVSPPSVRLGAHPAGGWWLSRIAPGGGFEAAVAVEGAAWGVRCWDGPPAVSARSVLTDSGTHGRSGRGVSIEGRYSDRGSFGTGLTR